MATYYAQSSSANINTAALWDTNPAGGGTDLVWANLQPTDILIANGQTAIAINVSFTCAKISTLTDGVGADGGGFTVSSAVTVTANVEAGGSTCIASSGTGYTWAVIGNVTAGNATNAHGINHSATVATSILNVTGNVTGGSAGNQGVRNNSTGTINITGNVTGGSAATAYGVGSLGTGVMTINGTIEGGSANTAYGLFISSTGIVTITGKLLYTATKASPVGGFANLSYTPASTDYIRLPQGAGTVDCPKGLAAGNIKAGVVSGTVTGTYAAGGGSLVAGRGLVG